MACETNGLVEGAPVRVGFRTQTVLLTEDRAAADLEATIALFEPIDDRAHVTLEGPEGELRAVIPNTRELEEGRDVGVALDRTKLYLFNPDDGTVIDSTQ